jgi:hypothetical protein
MKEREVIFRIHDMIHRYLGLPLYENMSGLEMIPFGLAIHEIINRCPVAMRTKKRRGVLIENGKVIDNDYTGPVLEMVLKKNKVIRTVPTYGKYKGYPVVVAPIRNINGEAVAAIGVVDLDYILGFKKEL